MKILNVIDIVFYRTFLSKIYLASGVEYEFIAPDVDLLAERTLDFAPDAVLLQETYVSERSADLAKAVRRYAPRSGHPVTFLVLTPMLSGGGDTTPEDVPRGRDVVQVNRSNLAAILTRLKAELAVRARQEQSGDDLDRSRAILVVDAGKTLLHVVRAALKPKHFRVVAAQDAEEALLFCRDHRFELVLTSVQLPGISGLELCRRLKESNPGSYLPVIVLSSSDDPLDVETAFNYGADDYLVKSFTPMMLADKVADHLDALERKRHNKILVVDDSKLIRELLRHSFIKAGLQVFTAEDGVQAFEIALAERPDVVITDIMMPRMDGYALCEKLRAHPELKNVFVVAMSGRGRQSDIKRSERLGVNRYFVKPFDVEKMQLVVEQLLAESYRHYKKEYEHVLASMKSLITALETRDEYTKGHTARVCEMCLALGRYMGLDEPTLRDLEIGANLHDIGKIGVRDAVLLKPGRLTDEEFAKIQEHAVLGAEILRPIASLAPIIPLIMFHHERWDGLGYPSAIQGEDIPLGARIIAIADAFDAMTTDRPYRRGMGEGTALAIIEEEAGGQFCPTCAAAFLRMMAERADQAETESRQAE